MKQKLHYVYIWFDYSLFLPFIACLPHKIGRKFARIRGTFYFNRRRDWRSFTFGENELFNRTYRAYLEMFPNLNDDEILQIVKKRCISQSLEEYESALFTKERYHKVEVSYENIEELKKYIDKGNNVTFMSAHFGSIIGVSFLSIFNRPVVHISSNITKNSVIHPSIRKHYLPRYSLAPKYMNGGEILDAENNIKKIIHHAKVGDFINVVADIPSNSVKNSLWSSFFGKQRAFNSILKMLSKTANSKIVPFVCYYEKGKYIMKFGDLEQEPYEFLENEIRQRPDMWWAADLLELYPIKENKNEI